MASTILTDVNFQSQVFKDTMLGEFTDRLGLLTAGILAEAPEQVISANDRGYTVAIPKWNTLSGDSVQVTSSTTTTINNFTDYKDIGVWVEREKAWGSDQMVAVVAGKDPTEEIARQLGTYGAIEMHKIALKVLAGVFDTALATTHSTGATYSGDIISPEAIIAAKQLLGDNNDLLRAIVMNSKVQSDAIKEKILTYDNGGAVTYNTGNTGNLLGLTPVVSDKLAAVSGVYSSYIGALSSMIYKLRNRPTQRFTNANTYKIGQFEVELNREAKTAGGQDELIMRWSGLAHVPGVQWNGTVATNPTDAQLATGANWTKVATDDKLIRLVELKRA